MNKVTCDKWVQEQYFSAGGVRDNTVFIGCTKEVLDFAYNELSKSNQEVKPINIRFDRSLLEKIENSLFGYDNDFYKTLFIRDYISCLFFLEFNKQFCVENYKNEQMEKVVEAFFKCDQKTLIENHAQMPMPGSTCTLKSTYGSFELNIFLDREPTFLLARAINSFLQTRAPYPIKVYTSQQFWASNLSLEGQLVQSIHDYKYCPIMDFVKVNNICKDNEKEDI